MKKIRRRSFIKRSLLVSAGSIMLPNFIEAVEKSANDITNNKILVIVQLSGGNDGLNMIVPYSNSRYYKARPQLAIPEKDVIKLSDEMGLHPNMTGLKNLYDDGLLCILNNVGYPDPNRSHFRSMDIWQSASRSNEYLQSGWIGRFIESNLNGKSYPYSAIEIGDTLSLALKGKLVKGLAMQNPQRLYNSIQKGLFQPLAKQYSAYKDYSKNLKYIYNTMNETISSVNYIYKKVNGSSSAGNYPPSALGQNLKTISEMIQSGINTKFYYTSLDGFDTHVHQRPKQDKLLKVYSEAISFFVNDLKQKDIFQNVLILTFSEFGRRVSQNASGGTDHGGANNLLLMGGHLKKSGFYNESPDLQNLNNGDLKYSIDFRSVYKTIIKSFFKENPFPIIGKTFPELHFI